ncbi:hypothetical protein [Carboxydothermus hydrogenoformans]|uniref:Uncharacterized protein n=1 Tax=Carboxydothermus hydrogenoformans (strain ATCC BAA-161 / DSM 6008 / Z-2901) TaxID=246194 RepID=Q3ABI8_CARHZ|nr:hypothetical protein [Carboxydothermus hydrogenoformans]ABB13857.1 hypothetical protein CHY_1676 [Carboxydothermus hydrogenoformans Z-2901]
MRVVISQVKAVPSARYGFVPRCVPWEINLIQDPNTGMIEQEINISVSMTCKHGYPAADGTITFFPTPEELADSPVPVLVIAVIYSGEIDETKVLKEISTEEDWQWLYNTYGVTKEHLGITG